MRRKILLSLSILIIGLLAALLMLPRLLNLDYYLQQVITNVHAVTGRTLTVDKGLSVNISLQPSLSLGGVKFANMSGSKDPQMVSIEKLYLQPKLLPLLYGEVHLKRIIATGVTLLLESDTKGNYNWDLQINQDEVPQLPIVEQLELNDLSLLRRDSAKGKTKQLKLQHLQIRDIGLLTPMRLTLDGSYRQQPLRMSAMATLSTELDNLQVEQLEAALGESDLSGDLTLQWDKKRPYLTANLHSQRFALTPVDTTEQTETNQQRKIFNPEPLPLTWLSGLDGIINYRLQEVTGIPFAITNLTTKIQLRRGLVTMTPLAFQVAGSSSSIDLNIDLQTSVPKIAATVTATGLDLGTIFVSPSGKPQFTGKGDLRAALQGEGTSVASLMASLSGHSRMLVGPGELRVSLDSVTGGPQHLLGALILPGSNSSRVNCLASEFEFQSGVATSRAFLLDAKHSTLFGDGTINLGSEQLNLLFKPKPKTATLNVAVPVRVGGTLADPTYTLEKSGTLRKAVGVAGLFVFPPAALLGLAEMGTGEQNPCLRIAAGEGISQAPEKGNIERGTDAIKGGLESVGGKIKGLLDN